MQRSIDDSQILKSWEKCMEEGVLYHQSGPGKKVTNSTYERKMKENEAVVNDFIRLMKPVRKLISAPISICIFDYGGVLLKKNRLPQQVVNAFYRRGCFLQ